MIVAKAHKLRYHGDKNKVSYNLYVKSVEFVEKCGKLFDFSEFELVVAIDAQVAYLTLSHMVAERLACWGLVPEDFSLIIVKSTPTPSGVHDGAMKFWVDSRNNMFQSEYFLHKVGDAVMSAEYESKDHYYDFMRLPALRVDCAH